MAVRAKFYVTSTHTDSNQEMVNLAPVWDTTGDNKEFWEATPFGHMHMVITNPGAQGFFKIGQEYYLDFTPASAPATAEV